MASPNLLWQPTGCNAEVGSAGRFCVASIVVTWGSWNQEICWNIRAQQWTTIHFYKLCSRSSCSAQEWTGFSGLFCGSAWDWKQRDAQLTGNLKCVQSLTMAMQKLSILPFFCVWVPLLHPVSMDLNCYGHETAITSFSFFQARRPFAANEASVSCIGCSHRRSELKLVKVESATVPAVPKDSCVACWWRSRGWKPGATAPQHVTWSSTEKDEEPRSEVCGDLLPSKSRVVGPEDVLMTMPTLSKCRWKEWSATHVGPHVGTKKEWWREQIGSCGTEGRASQSLSKHIKWERVETEHAPIWGTDSRLIILIK